MENQAEEYIKALQTTIAVKQMELQSLSGWHLLRRRQLRNEIRTGEQNFHNYFFMCGVVMDQQELFIDCPNI